MIWSAVSICCVSVIHTIDLFIVQWILGLECVTIHTFVRWYHIKSDIKVGNNMSSTIIRKIITDMTNTEAIVVRQLSFSILSSSSSHSRYISFLTLPWPTQVKRSKRAWNELEGSLLGCLSWSVSFIYLSWSFSLFLFALPLCLLILSVVSIILSSPVCRLTLTQTWLLWWAMCH